MSCCNGFNISTPVIPPVADGDGPLVSVAGFDSKKTLYLTGAFAGRFVFMGSHDDVNFVPIAQFDGDGQPRSAKIDVDATLSSMLLRRAAQVPGPLPTAFVASQLVCECSDAPPPPPVFLAADGGDVGDDGQPKARLSGKEKHAAEKAKAARGPDKPRDLKTAGDVIVRKPGSEGGPYHKAGPAKASAQAPAKAEIAATPAEVADDEAVTKGEKPAHKAMAVKASTPTPEPKKKK